MDYRRSIVTLCEAGVDFVVVGGVAASFHGSARLTFDLDICYSRASSNLSRLAAALAPYHPRPRGFPPELPFIWDDATLRNGSLFTLRTDLGDIDLLDEIIGLGTFEEVKANSVTVEAYGCRFATLNLRSLIAAKRASGREKDLSFIPELESLLEAEEE